MGLGGVKLPVTHLLCQVMKTTEGHMNIHICEYEQQISYTFIWSMRPNNELLPLYVPASTKQ